MTSRPFTPSSEAPLNLLHVTFPREQSHKLRELEWEDDWQNDPALLVPQPGARILGPKARFFLTLCAMALIFGAMAGTQFLD